MQADNSSNTSGGQSHTGNQANKGSQSHTGSPSTSMGSQATSGTQSGGNQRPQNPWQASNKGQSYWQQPGAALSQRGQASGGRQSGTRSDSLQGQSCSLQGSENVGSTERIISAGLGGLLVAGGIVRGRLPGLLLTAAGASLLYRGLSGFCALYQQLGITTNEMDDEQSGQHFFSPDHHAIKGAKIEEEFEIQQSPHELYELWTKWEQLPQYLPHIKKIEVLGEGRTRWSAYAPLGVTLTWEAETIKQEADRMVSWKSVKGDVGTAGSVHFDDAGSGKTRMRVSMQYDPPGGKATAQVAEFFGVGLDRRVRDDLQQFKHRLESRGHSHAS